jgi:hypothetical protein
MVDEKSKKKRKRVIPRATTRMNPKLPDKAAP